MTTAKFLQRFCTYALVEFSPVLVGAGVCPALILGVHANLGRVLSGEGPEMIMGSWVNHAHYYHYNCWCVNLGTRHCTAVSRIGLSAIFFSDVVAEMTKKVGPRLRELAPVAAAGGRQRKNIGTSCFTIPVTCKVGFD